MGGSCVSPRCCPCAAPCRPFDGGVASVPLPALCRGVLRPCARCFAKPPSDPAKCSGVERRCGGRNELCRLRQVDASTDVLSFPEFDLRPGELPAPEDADPGTGLVPLGDMVISMEHVAAQAREYGHAKRRELSYLVVHSVLHLLGYDHLDEGPQKARMRAREEAILGELGIGR